VGGGGQRRVADGRRAGGRRVADGRRRAGPPNTHRNNKIGQNHSFVGAI